MHGSGTVLFVQILLFFPLLAHTDRSPRPFEASCPKRCRCTSNKLDCRNARITPNDLQTVQPQAFVELDEMEFNGAKFGDIGEGLFPEHVVHVGVTLLNVNNSGVTRISGQTFQATPNVEFLYMSDNQIEYAGRDTFGALKKLKRLDLSNALKRRPVSSSVADLLSEMFESSGNGKNHLVELDTINLSNNGIKELHPSTFCKIKGLLRLDLSGNELTSFEVDEGCLPSLKSLSLGGNKFTTVPTSLWDRLGQVTALDISSNPLSCDCSLQPMVAIARDEQYDFINQGKTICESPESMKGKNVFEIKGDLCKSGGWGFGTFLILALIAGTVFFVYGRYRRRRRQMEVPFEFGYSGLEGDEDVQPEFV